MSKTFKTNQTNLKKHRTSKVIHTDKHIEPTTSKRKHTKVKDAVNKNTNTASANDYITKPKKLSRSFGFGLNG